MKIYHPQHFYYSEKETPTKPNPVKIQGFGVHVYRPEASLQVKCKSKAEKGY